MSRQNPVIEDRGPSKEAARFVCGTSAQALTWYTGSTAREAYDYWAKRTRAGRWHAHKTGFQPEFVRSTP